MHFVLGWLLFSVRFVGNAAAEWPAPQLGYLLWSVGDVINGSVLYTDTYKFPWMLASWYAISLIFVVSFEGEKTFREMESISARWPGRRW